MSAEIERKFLVSAAPDWLGDCHSARIEQGYLAIEEQAEVRLRRAEGLLVLTAKKGHGEVREEVEIALDPGQFAQLWPLTAGRRLAKTRHLVPLAGGLRAEVDVYAGPLRGLITAEVEFETEEQSHSFQVPDWLGEELTGDARYSNRSLASLGRPMSNPAEAGEDDGMTVDGQSRTYRLKREESAAEGVRRVARGRTDKAVERLRGGLDGDLAESIHGARKDLKKVRAVLRLVREDLGRTAFRAENRRYRDAGRLLSESRDAEVKLETLKALEERFGGHLPSGPLLNWCEALEADRKRIAGAAESEMAAKIQGAVEQIEAGEERIAGWPLKADSWQLLEPGLTRTYRDGRDAFEKAREDRSAESVHEFRKRAKDLWYELRLLGDAWPGLLDETAEQVHELGDLLGDHHDLAILQEDLVARAGVVAKGDAFKALIEKRQAELLDSALGLGERIYAEKPKHYRRRLRAYWRARRKPA